MPVATLVSKRINQVFLIGTGFYFCFGSFAVFRALDGSGAFRSSLVRLAMQSHDLAPPSCANITAFGLLKDGCKLPRTGLAISGSLASARFDHEVGMGLLLVCVCARAPARTCVCA